MLIIVHHKVVISQMADCITAPSSHETDIKKVYVALPFRTLCTDRYVSTIVNVPLGEDAAIKSVCLTYVAGIFVIDFMRELRRCCMCFRARSPPLSNAYLGVGRSAGGMATTTSRCGGCSAQGTLQPGGGEARSVTGNASYVVATPSACGLHRQVTPPYIAQGRGNKDHFDKYMML